MKLYSSPFYLFSILTVLICGKGYPQTIDISSQENRLVSLYSKLLKSFELGSDSTEYYSDRFSKEFENLIKRNPATLNHSFKRLSDSGYCEVKTSSNGNFKVYSWDTWTGGTAHFFNAIYQYRDSEKVFTKIKNCGDNDPGGFCSKIYTVSINNEFYYLPIFNRIYSAADCSQSVSVFAINNTKLIDTIKLFKMKTKYLNSIDVEFNFLSVVDRPERPVELIVYDDKQKIFYIPVVNDKNAVTTKNILYQLKDHYFEFIGIETGKRK